jgi:hypothetical protein
MGRAPKEVTMLGHKDDDPMHKDWQAISARRDELLHWRPKDGRVFRIRQLLAEPFTPEDTQRNNARERELDKLYRSLDRYWRRQHSKWRVVRSLTRKAGDVKT